MMRKRTGKIVNCIKCSKEFYSSGWKIKKGIGKYCSAECSKGCGIQKAIQAASLIKYRPSRKTGKQFKCIRCFCEFYVPKYRIKKSEVKYCSRSCLAKDLLTKYRIIHGFKKLNKPLHKYKIITVNGKQVREHRWIMEQHLGRKLESWEHVHHINDDSSDNRIENLEVLSNSDHQRKECKLRKKLFSSSS